MKSFINILKDNRGFFVFLLLMSVFRSGIADWNVVPSGSMKPTIVEGDRILVNKLAYDVQVPFLYHSLKKLNDPQRGDIIVFDSEVAQLRLVKRVIGLPGDVVEMVDNQLYINGQALQYDMLESYQNQVDEKEDLLGVVHTVRLIEKAHVCLRSSQQKCQRTSTSHWGTIVTTVPILA